MASEIVAEKAIEIIDQTKRMRESRHILTQMKVLYGNIEKAVDALQSCDARTNFGAKVEMGAISGRRGNVSFPRSGSCWEKGFFEKVGKIINNCYFLKPRFFFDLACFVRKFWILEKKRFGTNQLFDQYFCGYALVTMYSYV